MNNNNINAIEIIRTNLNTLHNSRSAWGRGVYEYACELVDELAEILRYDENALDNERLLRKALLNGAADWNQYSWGDCSLIYNEDIAERLCTPSELKKTRNGERKPNQREEWLDTQARALRHAERLVIKAYREYLK